MAVTDFKLVDGDLSFFNGDFDITSKFSTDADVQCIEDMLIYNKGELKEFPFLGVGVSNYLNSSTTTSYLKLRQDIALNLRADNFSAISINEQSGLVNFDFGSINVNINALRNE